MSAANHDTARLKQPLMPPWPAYLLQAISNGPAAVQPPPPPADWNALVAAAQAHQLAPLLYWTLQRASTVTQPPTAIREQLRVQYRMATLQSMQREHELRTVLLALNAAGIQPTLYKGAALAHTVYPTPTCRPMGDLDLWVTAEEMPVAQSTIEALGYRQKFKTARPVALQSQHDGEVQLVGEKTSKGLIELHWGVFAGQWIQRVTTIDRAGVRRRRVATNVLDASVYRLAHEDAIIQLAVHLGINHQLTLHPLRSLLDIALLAQQPVEWSAVVERARSWQLATILSVVLDLLVEIFGVATLPPGVVATAAAMRRSVGRRAMTSRWSSPDVVLQQQQISASRGRFLYLLSMIDSPINTLYLLWRALWPEQEWLAVRYGQADHAVRLQHIKSVLQGTL